jgi:hypothetical protein
MSPEQSRLLILSTAVLALVMGGMYLLRSRLRARRRRQREEIWRELCLRLELVPKPRTQHVAAGQLQGTDFSLQDTGSDWILELPLAQPLLPSRVVLLSSKDQRLRPSFRLRPLPWDSRVITPAVPVLFQGQAMASAKVRPVWFQDRAMAPAKVSASEAFLEEAERAAKAHEPLQVESRRLVHALRPQVPLSVTHVRDAVRALEATAQRWHTVVMQHGIPQVTELPRLPSASSVLRGELAKPRSRIWLLGINGGLLLVAAALRQQGQGFFFLLLSGSLIAGLIVIRTKGYGFKGFLLGALAMTSLFGAPWAWSRSMAPEIVPAEISVRDAGQIRYRKTGFFRFTDAVVRKDLAPGKQWVVPVVANNWEPGELVTVLAVGLPPASQGDAPLEGRVVERGTGAIQTALEYKFSLHSHVRFVDFSTPPDGHVAALKRRALGLWALPNVLWLGWGLWLWRREIKRQRQREESGEEAHEAE